MLLAQVFLPGGEPQVPLVDEAPNVRVDGVLRSAALQRHVSTVGVEASSSQASVTQGFTSAALRRRADRTDTAASLHRSDKYLVCLHQARR